MGTSRSVSARRPPWTDLSSTLGRSHGQHRVYFRPPIVVAQRNRKCWRNEPGTGDVAPACQRSPEHLVLVTENNLFLLFSSLSFFFFSFPVSILFSLYYHLTLPSLFVASFFPFINFLSSNSPWPFFSSFFGPVSPCTSLVFPLVTGRVLEDVVPRNPPVRTVVVPCGRTWIIVDCYRDTECTTGWWTGLERRQRCVTGTVREAAVGFVVKANRFDRSGKVGASDEPSRNVSFGPIFSSLL